MRSAGPRAWYRSTQRSKQNPLSPGGRVSSPSVPKPAFFGREGVLALRADGSPTRNRGQDALAPGNTRNRGQDALAPGNTRNRGQMPSLPGICHLVCVDLYLVNEVLLPNRDRDRFFDTVHCQASANRKGGRSAMPRSHVDGALIRHSGDLQAGIHSASPRDKIDRATRAPIEVFPPPVFHAEIRMLL